MCPRFDVEQLPDRARRAAASVRTGEPVQDLATLLDELADGLDAAQRHVVRLGLDLHDEGMQLVAALGSDLDLFRRQIHDLLEDSELREKAVGRADDLIARVTALDGVLREVVAYAQASSIAGRPLSESLRAIADLQPSACTFVFDLPPDLDSFDLTDTQRITLVRVVQSAVANVVQHSGASTATVVVRETPTAIEVEVVDDGRGFEVENATTEGRLGLEGMRLRAALVHGTFAVESRVGGPTRVFLRLPRWRAGAVDHS